MDKRHAIMMRSAREDRDRSRQMMADLMGVSYKTVWNWENSISYPTSKQFFDWFDLIGCDIGIYINHYYNNDFHEKDDKEIKKDIHRMIDSYTPRRRKMIYFIFAGKHGADIDAFLNLMVAYLQTQWKDRIVQSALVMSNFRLNRERKEYSVKPNLELLNKSILSCSESYLMGKGEYKLKINDKLEE